MSRMFGVVNLFALIFMGGLIIAWTTYNHNAKEEFERLRLSTAIDYAVDAGAEAMLGTGSLDMDYADAQNMTVNPELAMDAFLDVFAFNYDMVPSKENKQLIKEYIPVMAVSTFDGFYIASQELVKNSKDYPENASDDADWDLVFGMKRPYPYKYNNVSYALNMGLDYSWTMTGNVLGRHEGMPPKLGGYLSEEEVWHVINSSISEDMAYTIAETNQENPNWSHQFYIPDRLTSISGVNTIRGPSFIVLVQGLDFTTPRPISGFSIGGSRIQTARMVVAYQRNGNRYYCYADKMPEGVTVENVYSSIKEAALEGYYADQQYMQ